MTTKPNRDLTTEIVLVLIGFLFAVLAGRAALGSEQRKDDAFAASPAPWMVAAANASSPSCGWRPAGTPAHVISATVPPMPTQRTLPLTQDQTRWNPGDGYPPDKPVWLEVAADGNLVATASGYGVQLWNVANPKSPIRRWYARPLHHGTGGSHDFWKYRRVALTSGLVLMTGGESMGFVALDSGTGAIRYEDSGAGDGGKGKDASDFGAVAAAGRYGYLAATGAIPGDWGLWQYDVSRIRALPGPCFDRLPASGSCGVFVKRISTARLRHVSAVANLVAASGGGLGAEGFAVYDDTGRDLVRGGVGKVVTGLSLWQANGATYLALAQRPKTSSAAEVLVTRLTCAGGSCILQPLWSKALTPTLLDVNVRASGGHLHVGGPGWSDKQTEWLFDVRNPASPRPVGTPDFWQWYSPCRVLTGSNGFAGQDGVVVGNVLWRAGVTIFDGLALTGGIAPVPPPTEPIPPTIPPEKPPEEPVPPKPPVTPVLTFSVSPPEPIAGREALFVATVRPATPLSGSPVWVFRDVGSAVGTTARITFPRAGNYQVSVSVVPVGCSSPHCVLAASAVVTVAAGSEPPPPPDIDGDGVPDEFDDCPASPGPPPRGCPVETPSDDPTTCTPPRVLTAPGRVIYRPSKKSTGRIDLEIIGDWECVEPGADLLPKDATNDEGTVTP